MNKVSHGPRRTSGASIHRGLQPLDVRCRLARHNEQTRKGKGKRKRTGVGGSGKEEDCSVAEALKTSKQPKEESGSTQYQGPAAAAYLHRTAQRVIASRRKERASKGTQQRKTVSS